MPSPPDLLPIAQAGDPVLRRVAEPIADGDLGSPALDALVTAMRDTMRAAPGVGLAAPQVGRSLALAVVEDRAEYQKNLSKDERASREREPVPFHVLVNPRLTVVDDTPVELFEGCLSVAGFFALVPRARAVRVDGKNALGEPVTIEARGWYARILQHEIDHLHGTLCIDRMLPRTFTTRENFDQHWSALSVAEVRARLALGAPTRGGVPRQ